MFWLDIVQVFGGSATPLGFLFELVEKSTFNLNISVAVRFTHNGFCSEILKPQSSFLVFVHRSSEAADE